MSDKNKVANENAEAKREPFSIEIEPADFSARATGANDFITSFELCNMINTIMKQIFDDYEGSIFEVAQNGAPIVSLFFHHRLPDDQDACKAFLQKSEETQYKNKLVGRVVYQNRLAREGNSYKISQDAMEGLDKFIYDSFRDRKGKVRWNEITMDVAQPNSREVLSKVYGIDPVSILKLVYGTKVDDKEYDYEVQIKNSLAANAFTGAGAGFLLGVTQIDKIQLDRALRNAGIVNPNGLGIIK